jgi:hypothetical protein
MSEINATDVANAVVTMQVTRPYRAILAQVAAHPLVVAYRQSQARYVERMTAMYGAEFANEGNGQEGVNRWTPAQRDVYESMMRGAKLTRDRVRASLGA